MLTLEKALMDYFTLSRPAFVQNNPVVPKIFSGAAVALATQMWVDGAPPDPMPGVFYIALLGEQGTGKTEFVEAHTRLFQKTDIAPLDVGSPPAFVMNLEENIKNGHPVNYLYFDEIDRLAANIKGYMASFLPILNIMYGLGRIGQKRTRKEASVVIPAESYFIHAYFTGVPSSWSRIESEAERGFVRRTLVINVIGELPYYTKEPVRKSIEMVKYRAQLFNKLQDLMSVLTGLRITVHLPEYPHLESMLRKTPLKTAHRRLVSDYTQKLIAAKVIANLIPFDIEADYSTMGPLTIADWMLSKGKRLGVDVHIVDRVHRPYLIDIYVPDIEEGDSQTSLQAFLPPHYEISIQNLVLDALGATPKAPDEVIAENIEKIKRWLEGGGSPVLSWSQFGREILTTGKPQNYKAVIEMLSDLNYIKTVDYVYRGRPAKYVVLDPKARICANCVHFRTENCPRLKGVVDLKERIMLVPPWAKPCEKFELEKEPEPEEVKE